MVWGDAACRGGVPEKGAVEPRPEELREVAGPSTETLCHRSTVPQGRAGGRMHSQGIGGPGVSLLTLCQQQADMGALDQCLAGGKGAGGARPWGRWATGSGGGGLVG